MAFDGKVLYFLPDASTDILYRLDPDSGAVLGQTTLWSGSYDGMAALGGLVYVIETNTDTIFGLDPTTGAVRKTLSVGALNPGMSFSGGLGEIADPDRLVATLMTNDVVLIDPSTGLVTSTFSHGYSGDYGVTAVGNRIYVGFSGAMRVYTRGGTLKQTLNVPLSLYALGGQAALDGGQHVKVGTSQIVTGKDFGNRYILGEIHGSLFVDTDGDGARDPGESAHAGVTVFLIPITTGSSISASRVR